MTGSNVKRRLSSLSDEIARARTELSILREQLPSRTAVLEEARVRMLVAETPLADREFQVASDDHRRIERSVAEQEMAHRRAGRGAGQVSCSRSRSGRPGERGDGSPTRILIAEDEALIRLDLREMLEEEGYRGRGGGRRRRDRRPAGPRPAARPHRDGHQDARPGRPRRRRAHHRGEAVPRAHPHRVQPEGPGGAGRANRSHGLSRKTVPEERPGARDRHRRGALPGDPGPRGRRSGISPSAWRRARWSIGPRAC